MLKLKILTSSVTTSRFPLAGLKINYARTEEKERNCHALHVFKTVLSGSQAEEI